MITIRFRSMMWFASGVAITLLLVTVFVGVRARADVNPAEATFVPITPCRLADTRSGIDNVGTRDTPVGPAESFVQQVTGTNGNCTIPTDATGVALNVTSVGATAGSFLALYPADAVRPTVSNLNYRPGQAPTPNKVDVKLSPTGAIRIFNNAGSVDVIADIAGYYTAKGLADLQAQINTKAAASALAGKADAATVYTKAEIDALLAAKSDVPTGSASVRISASAFTPTSDTDSGLLWELAYDSWVAQTFTERCVVAPVTLPDGATITQVTARFQSSATESGTVTMYSRLNSGIGAVAIASIPMPAGAGFTTASDTSISTPVVGANFDYSVAACLPSSSSFFNSVTIDFTYPT